jgi:spermidine synthase
MAKNTKPQQASVSIPNTKDPSSLAVRIALGIICFLAGAAVMVIEISAYRLLAPLFGNSVYTWTALIGVVLIAFSAGGFLGGWLADRKLALDLLGWLLAGAAVLTFFVPAIHAVIRPRFEGSGLITGPVMLSLVLFAVPGILLGAVSPASVRFFSLVGKDEHVGSAAGTISMLGSLGSFVGTFACGFFLLSHFGVRSIFLGTAVVLLALAMVAFFLARNTLKQQVPIIVAGLFAAGVGLTAKEEQDQNTIWQHNSYYHRIEVIENGAGQFAQRFIKLDNTMEGGMRVHDGALVLDYQHFWKIAMMRDNPDIKSALFIGAGAFGMPLDVSRNFPDAQVDVLEIDPMVIEAGRKFFKLDDFPKVAAHAGDARRFMLNNSKKWDLIFGDAYNGVRQIPPHLASGEFFQLVSDRLSPGGVFLMNVITAVQGPKSEVLAGMISTLRKVFPHVEAFGVQGAGGSHTQNVILLASREDMRPLFTDRTYASTSPSARFVRARIPEETWPRSEVVFTDDFNPVDALIASGLRE